ncbi:MAG: hypothetical protein ACPGSD_00160 [Flavobacteriales bacterium]
MILDYKPEIKEVLSSLFKPADIDSNEVDFLTLSELIENLGRVMPIKHLSETDVYECLKESGFKISQDHENQFGFMVQKII